jgi:hypothetical protein
MGHDDFGLLRLRLHGISPEADVDDRLISNIASLRAAFGRLFVWAADVQVIDAVGSSKGRQHLRRCLCGNGMRRVLQTDKGIYVGKGDDYTQVRRLIGALRHFNATVHSQQLKRSDSRKYSKLRFDAVINFSQALGEPFWNSHWAVWDYNMQGIA